MHHKEKLFALMFRRHYDAMYRFAFSFLRDYEESRDVVSEVFARLWDEGTPLKQDNAARLSALMRTEQVSQPDRTEGTGRETEEAVSAADAAPRRAG